MKTKILLITLIALFVITKKSNATEVFPTSDAIWVIHVYNHGQHQYVYGLSGDTIINEMTYQKLYLLNDTTLTIDHEDIYVAGIRQTTEKQVFIQPADQKDGSKFEEFLMYDFGKGIGEEIKLGKKPYMGWGDSGPTFEEVDIKWLTIDQFVMIKNITETKNGKEFDVSEDMWLEGVGSLSGLFFYPLRFPTCPCPPPSGALLICMKEHGKVKYLSDSHGVQCTSCFNESYFLSITSNELNNNVLVSYSSPQNSIEIKFNNEHPLTEFSLLSIDGKNVLKTTISESQTSININNIPKGVYIYKIAGDNTNQSGKLIIK